MMNKNRILQYLEHPMTIPELVSTLGDLDENNIRVYINRLKREKKIIETGQKGKAKLYQCQKDINFQVLPVYSGYYDDILALQYTEQFYAQELQELLSGHLNLLILSEHSEPMENRIVQGILGLLGKENVSITPSSIIRERIQNLLSLQYKMAEKEYSQIYYYKIKIPHLFYVESGCYKFLISDKNLKSQQRNSNLVEHMAIKRLLTIGKKEKKLENSGDPDSIRINMQELGTNSAFNDIFPHLFTKEERGPINIEFDQLLKFFDKQMEIHNIPKETKKICSVFKIYLIFLQILKRRNIELDLDYDAHGEIERIRIIP